MRPRRYHVVVTTGNLENAIACVETLLEHHPLTPADVTLSTSLPREAVASLPVTYLPQRRPFCLAAAWNDAIASLPLDVDVVLVGSDVRFRGEALTELAAAARGDAILSPALHGYRWHDERLAPHPGAGPRVCARYFGFVCPYVPREVWRAVGRFDERFTGYGSEDVDYALRARQAGVRLVVLPRVAVWHVAGRSEWRDMAGGEPAGIHENRLAFARKWGVRWDEVDWTNPARHKERA